MSRITLRSCVCFTYVIFLVCEALAAAENDCLVNGRNRRSFASRKGERQHALGNSLKTTSGSRASVFATENSTVVSAQIGGTAILPCVVRKFSSGMVSWLRKQEPPSLLTVGPTTYSADDRFLVEHVRHLQNWGLMIKHVQPTDAGWYECQVSTHPPVSIFVRLKVTEAVADILGAPDLHLRAGSLLRLVCTLKESTETPSHVFWYLEHRMINFDEKVTVLTDRSSSILLVEETDQRHSGNYTCTPANAVPASINVHVLNATEEEKPAAMLHAGSSTLTFSVLLVLPLLTFLGMES